MSQRRRFRAVLEALDRRVLMTGAPGQLDPNFGSGGYAVADTAAFEEFAAVTRQADGKFVAVGYRGSTASFSTGAALVARFNPNGTLDTSFNGTGVLTIDRFTNGEQFRAVAVQGDGRIVAVGDGYSGSTQLPLITRIDSSGSIDTSFGSSGFVSNIPGAQTSGANLLGVTVQGDGKIVFAGSALAIADGGNVHFFAGRLTASGTYDTTFGTANTGTSFQITSAESDNVYAVKFQPDGKVLMAGDVDTSSPRNGKLVRFNPDGTLDAGFGAGGVSLLTIPGTGAPLTAVAVNPSNGSIMAYTNISTGSDRLYRLTPAGQVDNSFGGGSGFIATQTLFGPASDLLVRPDGQTVVATQFGDLHKVTTRGALNPTWGDAGTATLGVSAAGAVLVADVDEGNVVVAGTSGGAAVLAAVGDPVDSAAPTAVAPVTEQPAVGADSFDFSILYQDDLEIDPLTIPAAVVTVAGNTAGGPYSAPAVFMGLEPSDTGGYVARYRVAAPGGAWDAADTGSFSVSIAPGAVADYAGNTVAGGQVGIIGFNFQGAYDSSFGYVGRAVVGRDRSGGFNAVTLGADGQIIGIGETFGSFGQDMLIRAVFPNGRPNDRLTAVYNDSDNFPSTGAAVARQGDGKLLVAGTLFGDFTVWRYNADNTLDTTFANGDGLVTLDFGGALDAGTTTDFATGIAVDGSGRIYVVGGVIGNGQQAAGLARLTSSGMPDTSFGFGGLTTVNVGPSGQAMGNAVAVDSQGRVIVAAVEDLNSGSPRGVIARLSPFGGGLDTSFGAGGRVNLGTSHPAAVVVLGGDSIAFAGHAFGFSRGVAGMVTAGGTLDGAFAGQTANLATATSLAVTGNGGLIVGGMTLGEQFGAVRVTNVGVFDTGFGAGGLATVAFGAPDAEVRGVTIQPDGRIVLAGNAGSQPAVARLTANGQVDPSFGLPGRFQLTDGLGSGGEDAARAIAVQPDGKIVLAGTDSNDVLLMRINPDGTLDTTFNGDGTRLFSSGSFNAVAVLPGGKILAAGRGFNAGTSSDDFVVYRFNADGSTDSSFAGSGRVFVDFGGVNDEANSMVLLGDPANPTILLGGYTATVSGEDFALARLNPDGSLDSSFGTGGRTVTNLPGGGNTDDFVDTLAVAADGRIVAFGGSFASGVGRAALARYSANGVLDTSFGSGGSTVTNLGVTGGGVFTTGGAILADGRLLALAFDPDEVGNTTVLARFSGNGVLDTSFGSGGKVTPFGDEVRSTAMLVDPAGRIYIGGDGFTVGRLNPDGTVDVSFGTFGRTLPFYPPQVTDRSGPSLFDQQVYALALLADGSVFAAGSVLPTGSFDNVVAAARYLTTAAAVSDLGVPNFNTPASATPGQSVTFSGDLANGGSSPAANATVTVVASLDNVLGNGDDVVLGSGVAGTVPANGSLPFSLPVTVPGNLAAGSYTVFAVADFANAIVETNEGNNASVGSTFVVTGTAAAPDLIPTGVTFPSTATAGTGVTILPSMANPGAAAGPFGVGFYLSLDGIFGNGDDIFLGTNQYSGLGTTPANAPAALAAATLTIPAGTAAGSYRVIVVADPFGEVPEGDDNNNVFVSTSTIDVAAAAVLPDLAVAGASYGPAVNSGALFTITPTLQNTGGAASGAVTVNVFLSSDTVFGNADDVFIGTAVYPELAAGQTATVSPFSAVVPSTVAAGNYFVITFVDPNGIVVEADESDNILVSSPVTVSPPPAPPANKPDLYFSFLAFTPGSYTAGTPFTFNPTVGNSGTLPTGAFTVQTRLSVDSVFGNADDLIISVINAGSLAAGATANLGPVTVDLPGNLPVGNFFLLSVADVGNGVDEQLETNNVFAAATPSLTVLAAPVLNTGAGSLNPDFGGGDGVADTTFAVLFTTVDARSDAAGRLVVTGFTSTGDLFLTRFNPDGTLDPTFGDGGRVIADVRGTFDTAASLAIDPDTGFIYVAAHSASPSDAADNDFVLARFDVDGALDASFGLNGFAITDLARVRGQVTSDDRATALSLMAGGKFLLAGSTTLAGGNADFALLRLNADGSADTSFNGNGLVTLDFFGRDDNANAVAVESDGQIVLAGSADNAAGTATFMAVARVNANGTIDTRFGERGTPGRATFSLRNVDDEAFAVAIQSDGKIVVGGLSAAGSLDNGTLTTAFATIRLTSRGRLDGSFARGAAITDVPGSALSGVNRLVVQSDGKILVAGKTAASLQDALAGNLGAALARYNANGTLDTSFSEDGVLVLFTPVAAPSAPAAPGDSGSLSSQFDAFAMSAQGIVDITPGGGILALATSQDAAASTTTVSLASVVADGADLTAALTTAGVRASVLGGAKGTAVVNITNTGSLPARGVVQVKLYLSADRTLSSDDRAFTTVNLSVNLRPRQRRAFRINFTFPTDLPDGAYFLLTDINTNPATGPAELNDTNNIASVATATTVAAPFVDLSAAFTGAVPSALTPGRRQSVSVRVTNNGNTNARGAATLQLFASADQTLDSTDVLLGTLPRSLNLRPGQSQVLRLNFTPLAGAVPPGTTFLAATIQAAADTNAENNTTFSTTAVTVP